MSYLFCEERDLSLDRPKKVRVLYISTFAKRDIRRRRFACVSRETAVVAAPSDLASRCPRTHGSSLTKRKDLTVLIEGSSTFVIERFRAHIERKGLEIRPRELSLVKTRTENGS